MHNNFFLNAFTLSEQRSSLHKLDPRSKGFMLLVLMILCFIFNTLLLQMIIYIILIFGSVYSKIFLKTIQSISSLCFLFIIILLMNTYFISLNQALTTIFRILNLITMFSLYFQTTNPDDMMQSMIKMRIPYNFAFSFSLSFRFVPTLGEEMLIIQDAQKSRGHQIEEGSFFQKIRNWFPILIPLLLNSIYRAFHIAEALETRGFGSTEKMTSYYPVQFSKNDYITFILSIILLCVGILIKTQSDIFPSYIYWNLSL